MFRQKTLLTFDQLKAAFQPFGLPVEETRGDNHSSAVKIVHDGVPYKPDPDLIKGPHPLVENIDVRCWDKSIKHTPPEIPAAPARPYPQPVRRSNPLRTKKMGSGPRNRPPPRATTPFAPRYPTNGY